jgi:transcriptional regulator with GAF, ATPase, and Fis domain
MIDEWFEMKTRHEEEIAEFLQRMADQGYSRSQAAQLLNKNTSSISYMVKKHELNWPIRLSGHGRKGYTPEDYRELAEAGCSKAEAALELGVHRNTVDEMAKAHKIKFRDGRRIV